MSWQHNPYGNDSRTGIGIALIGGAVLFSHVIFPLIYWHLMAARSITTIPMLS